MKSHETAAWEIGNKFAWDGKGESRKSLKYRTKVKINKEKKESTRELLLKPFFFSVFFCKTHDPTCSERDLSHFANK